jgi:hypothetical protein
MPVKRRIQLPIVNFHFHDFGLQAKFDSGIITFRDCSRTVVDLGADSKARRKRRLRDVRPVFCIEAHVEGYRVWLPAAACQNLPVRS